MFVPVDVTDVAQVRPAQTGGFNELLHIDGVHLHVPGGG